MMAIVNNTEVFKSDVVLINTFRLSLRDTKYISRLKGFHCVKQSPLTACDGKPCGFLGGAYSRGLTHFWLRLALLT